MVLDNSLAPPAAGTRPSCPALIDRLGVCASALCLVHCALTPVLLGFSATLAVVLPGDAVVHRSLAVAVALLGTVALLRGYRRHRQHAVLWMMCLGLGCIAGTAWWGEQLPSHTWEIAITGVGSFLMVGAHRRNHRACRCACVKTGCAAHA